MNKILITGGAGYIGSHTVCHLISSGINAGDIVVMDNLSEGNRSMIPVGVKFIHGDLRNASDVINIFKSNNIECVVHFAGSAYVGESMENPAKYFDNNVNGTINLLNAMVGAKCLKIVFSSTCAIYGMQNTSAINESHTQIPINPYGESKLMVEKVLDWYGLSYNLKSVSLRYFNAGGAAYEIGESHDPETHIIPLIFNAAMSGSAIKIFGNDYPTEDGTCVRDYIHVKDLAEAHLLSINHLSTMDSNREYFNLGAQSGVSLLKLIDVVSEVSGIDIKYEISSRRKGDPPILIADCSKAKAVLGWVAINDIKDIVKSAWLWFVRNNININSDTR